MLLTMTTNHDWKLSRSKKGIEIYTRPIEGSDFLEFKGITNVSTNLATLVGLLWNLDDMPLWSSGCLETKLISMNGDLDRTVYLVNDAPFPLKKRDLVMNNRVIQNSETKTVTYTMDLVSHPIKSKHVHVKSITGTVELVPISAAETQVIYQSHIDPGGNIPSWAVNWFVNDVPLETLEKLTNILTRQSFAPHKLIQNFG